MKCDECNKSIPEQLDYCPSCKMARKLGYSNYKVKKQEREKTIETKQPNVFMNTVGRVFMIALGWITILILLLIVSPPLAGIFFFITFFIISLAYFLFRQHLVFLLFGGGKTGFNKRK